MKASPRWFTASLALSSIFSLPALAQPIEAVLKLQERTPIETLARNVLDPASPRYGQYYTPDEIRELAAPSQEDYTRLLAQLKGEGFTIAAESRTHLYVTVTADSSLFEKAFHTQIAFFANGKHRNLKPAVSRLPLIESVSGLDNIQERKPHLVQPAHRDSSPGGIPQATIKAAYGFNPIYKAGITGKGQHIAIATYDGFKVDEVKKFYKLSNLKPTPSVDQVQYNGTPNYDENSAMETELDAEFSGMMAPGAAVHVFASAHNDDAGELQMFTAILDDNRAQVVNYSWGMCEKGLAADHQKEMDKVFNRAVAQGVNIMVASGDSGSDSCQDGSTVADWPAAHPSVVAVGGTTFAQNGSHLAETAWNGSGGGISGLWALPSWQTGLGSAYAKRSYPDVAFNADPASGQAIWASQYGTAGWAVIGGTSMAAPQWSGFMALVGEARAKAGKGSLGFLNPILYGMSGAEQSGTLNDVTSGSNGAYHAAAGWDATTGFGSMQAKALLDNLVAR